MLCELLSLIVAVVGAAINDETPSPLAILLGILLDVVALLKSAGVAESRLERNS